MDGNIVNQVTLRGTITRTKMKDKRTAVYTIATDGDKGNSYFPEVYHTVNGADDVWRAGEQATVIARVRSSKTRDEVGNTVYFKQLIVKKITRTERILSKYISGIPAKGTVPNDINEFGFCGIVHSVYNKNSKQSILTLRLPEDEAYAAYVDVVGFDRDADVMRKAEKGDRLAVAGSIRTAMKGKRLIFDFVAKDVYLMKAK